MGKTELAYLLARTMLDRFPDGVRTVDLDDFRWEDDTLDPGDVLTHLLCSLDVEPNLIANSFKARCRQYWTKTSGAKLVLVLDNVRYASELVPLLPASGDSVVIVAGHRPLHDLESGAAVGMPLPPLEEHEARELLSLIVRDPRLAGDPEAVRALVRMCEGLPTALHVAGRWVRAHRIRPMARLVPQLRGEWESRGIPGVERLWDEVYDKLSPAAALLYRLLPHHPAATFTVRSATALLGLGAEDSEEAIEELDRAGLLDLRATDGRLRLQGPLQGHALRRSRRDAADGEVAEAQVRVLRWFVRQAQIADRFAAGQRLRVVDHFAEMPEAPDVPLEDPKETTETELAAERSALALRWLFEERHSLFACARLAHGRELDAETVALSEAVWTYALDHPRQPEVEQVLRLATECAVRSGQAAWMARTCCQLARPLWEADRLEEAQEQIDRAIAAVRLLGRNELDRKLAASVQEFQGMLHGRRGEWQQALAEYSAARDVHRGLSNSEYGVMLQTYRMGEARSKLGDLETARSLLEEAHAGISAQRRERMTGRSAFLLAGVVRGLGDPAGARRLYQQSLDSARRRNSGFDLLRIHDALAELGEEEGRLAEAEEHRTAARAIRQRSGLDE
uniref:tetratricopeptide repeat protein n=1 Tax=Streptomyces polyasparticus TaxID=2767826 RepID=UPI00280C0567|nr:tetratricopeptide repeat protein [Streptomyces polyasparticus]